MKTWILLVVLALGSSAAWGQSKPPRVSAAVLQRELCNVNPGLATLARFSDADYVVIDHGWLTGTFVPYFRSYLLHMRLGFEREGFDCDNFAFLFRSQLMLSNIIAGGAREGEVPCGLLSVRQVHESAGVKGSRRGRHALVLVRTDRGWCVIEPQNGAIMVLSAYPNLPFVVDVLI